MRHRPTHARCSLHPAYHRRLLTLLASFDRLDNDGQETVLLLAEIWAENEDRRRWQTRPLSDDEPVRVLGGKR